MKKQYYPLLRYFSIAVLFFVCTFDSTAQKIKLKNARRVPTSLVDCVHVPVINCPPHYNACPGASTSPNVSLFATAVAGGPDCDPPVVAFIDRVIDTGSCAGAKVIQRLWTAQDPGNSLLRSFCIQYLNTLDTTAPLFINCPRDTSILSNPHCMAQFSWNTPSVTDACGNFSVKSSAVNGGEYGVGRHNINYTATDECGNTSVCNFTLEVLSNCCEAPLIKCPANYTGCPGNDTDPSITGTATAEKSLPNCRTPVVTFTDRIIQSDTCLTIIERTWIALDPDNPNAQSSCIQTIRLQDTIKPFITSCPTNITVSTTDSTCLATVTWPPATAVDNCGSVTLTSTLPSGWKFSPGVSAVAIVATDPCGNAFKCEFLVKVNDICCKTPPVINCPPSYTGCPGSSIDPAVTGTAIATPGDTNCKTPILSFTDQIIRTSDCETEILRTWKAIDPKRTQLFSTCEQTIKLEDKTAPVITFCPPDVTVQSGNDCTANVNWTSPIGTDNCGLINFSSSIPSGSVFQVGNTTIVVTASDNCGNSSTCSFIVTVEEDCCKLPPVINCPADYVGCPGGSIDPSVTGTATATPADTNCNTPVLSFTDQVLISSTCETGIIRTWQAVDPIKPHLISTCEQIIKLEDKTTPAIVSCPPNVTVQSGSDCTATVNWSPPIATDNCSNLSITTSVPSGSVFQIGKTPVVVTAFDSCGNSAICEFSVTVEGTCCKFPPLIICPSDYTSCFGSDINPNTTGLAIAIPGDIHCQLPILSFRDDTINTANCLLELNRTWIAIDPIDSLLRSSCTQKIILKDDVPPVIALCPSNITVSSDDDCLAIVSWNEPVAFDGCGTPVITLSIASGSRFPLGVSNVVVTATDACGNASSCEFTVTVEENCCNRPPSMNCPDDYRGCPGGSIDTSVTGYATVDSFQSICQQPVITYADSNFSTGPCNQFFLRIWSAVNPKNNETSYCTQQITLEDLELPVFSDCPPDVTVDPEYNCQKVITWTPPVANDNCGIKSVTSTHTPGSTFNKGVTTVVYTATDNCGNTSTCWFFVTITDNCCDKNPILHCPPNYSSCPGTGTNPTVTGRATAEPGKTNCQQPLISFTDRVITNGPCAGATKVERTWIAVDPVINTLRTECIQLIELKDTAAPIIRNMPANLTVNAKGKCEIPVFWIHPIALDDCGINTFTFSDRPGALFSAGTKTITYTATDFCGGVTKDSFKITVAGTEIGIYCPDDTIVVRTDPFVNGAFVDWNTPLVKYCNPCKDNIPGFIYMGELDGHRYFCSQGEASWALAKFRAEQLGGKLAFIETEKENSFLASKLMGLTAWIGGTDERTEGNFEWTDHSQIRFSRWLPGQPNDAGGNEDYIELLPDGTWNDQNGSVNREYIMEIPCYDLTQIGGTPKGEFLPCGENKITYVAKKDGKSDTCSFIVSVDCDKENIYCKAKGLNSAHMYINRVEFAGIDTTTGDNGGYKFFNTTCGKVTQGKSYPICVSPGFLNSTYTVYWKIWIDFNADGFFDPVTEEVVYGFGTTTMCANLTMPASLPSKQTRMRVIMSYLNYPANPCTSPVFGEVEDYCILMNGATSSLPENETDGIRFNPVQLHCAANCEETDEKKSDDINISDELNPRNEKISIFDVSLFPNPSSQKVNVISNSSDLTDYEIYNNHGKMILRSVDREAGPSFSFSVGDWPNGIYTIIINNNEGRHLIKRFTVNH